MSHPAVIAGFWMFGNNDGLMSRPTMFKTNFTVGVFPRLATAVLPTNSDLEGRIFSCLMFARCLANTVGHLFGGFAINLLEFAGSFGDRRNQSEGLIRSFHRAVSQRHEPERLRQRFHQCLPRLAAANRF